ncbi:VCBS repeat-containing protein [Pleurocapsa sp. PCC 7319]|uniref:FG-GAP repeat domain-containing protein n=1 Tax=Pleurocapsa sp. PCC 7319 TaxID=118161 RepID=UPI000345712B|nr:VCBS repeat-containing protein [Pleurocapsa sp. PCC 7319]
MFFNRIDYPANEAPRGIASADFDGDGDQDIVVANPGVDPSSVEPDSGNEISVLSNNGDGTFAAPVTFTTGVGPRVSVGDFDGDGNIDIATSNATNNTISILFNDGQGVFAVPVDFSTGKEPLINTPVDLDGDGDLDIITSNQDSVNLNTAIFTGDTISILRNNGEGEFAAPETLTVGEGVFLVATGDLDGDDDLDIVTSNERDDTLSVLFNNGADGFSDPVDLEAGRRPTSPIISDLDGDGDLDIATSNFGSGDVSVLLNNGDGTFATGNVFDTEDSPSDLQAADLDGDGDIDFAMRHSVFFTRSGNTTGSTISILRNNGDGTFAEPEILSVGNTPSGLVVDDFDGEGELDLATPNFDDDSVTVYLNQPFQISGLKFNDLNGNGFRDTDLIQGINPDVVFTLDVSGSADEPFEGISVGDANGDGIADTRL